MQIHGTDAVLNLAAEQCLRITSRGPIEVECLGGLLWVTQSGDARDLFVASGGALRLLPGELTLVTALQPAALRVRELPLVAGAPRWRRWASRLAAPQTTSSLLRVGTQDTLSSL